jgi:hypothetical protein
MKISDSIRKSIDDWEANELEASMLHACNAVDGTASKFYDTQGSNARFTRLLRDYYYILGPMGMPGIDLVNVRWPVNVPNPKANDGRPISPTLFMEYTGAATGTERLCRTDSS